MFYRAKVKVWHEIPYTDGERSSYTFEVQEVFYDQLMATIKDTIDRGPEFHRFSIEVDASS